MDPLCVDRLLMPLLFVMEALHHKLGTRIRKLRADAVWQS
jgi:hypothetical protein